MLLLLMFNGFTNLTSVPKLPATTLAIGCYWSMFSNYTNSTEAPELLAITLTKSCYETMFNSCKI